MPSSALLFVLVFLFLSVLSGAASAQASTVSGSVFYFHNYQQIYRNENQSATLLDEADFAFPSETVPRSIEVSAGIRNATTVFGSIWVGSVGWVTQPLSEAVSIRGMVAFAVWLSSDDVTPSLSGVGAGIAVLDQENRTVGNYVYAYSFAQGNILSSNPSQYNFNVEFDRDLSAGQRLVFAVGVGSTTEGWRMNVLFDDPQHPSRAQLPSDVSVPEFPATMITLTVFTVLLIAVSLAPRRLPGTVRAHARNAERL